MMYSIQPCAHGVKQPGAAADILVDMSDPGIWLANCHIAERLQSGMISGLSVTGEDLTR